MIPFRGICQKWSTVKLKKKNGIYFSMTIDKSIAKMKN